MLLDAFGCRWRLDTSGLEPALAERLEKLWDRARVPDGADAGPEGGSGTWDFVVDQRDDGAIVINGSLYQVNDEDVPYAVSRTLTNQSITRRTGECLMLHAAGLATPDGATVALVAASGTGKTTAGRVLGRRLGYVSDETVAVEADLRVRAYPKPLSVVVDPADPLGKAEHSPDELGLVRAPAGLRLAATVILERTQEVEAPVLEPFPVVEAAALALPQTSALMSLTDPLDRLAEVLTAGHGPWHLRYREIADCADLLADLAGGGAPGGELEAVTWSTISGAAPRDPSLPDRPEGDGPGGVEPSLGAVVVRAPFDHALVADGSVLVLRDLVPTTLPGIAATLWLATDGPTEVARLLDVAVEAHGPHPEAESLVVATVRSLAEAGLLRVRAAGPA